MKTADEDNLANGRRETTTDDPLGAFASVSTRTMLESLSRAHPLVVALDASKRIAWISDELGLISPRLARCVGQPIDALLGQLEVADRSDFRERARAFLDELHRAGRVRSARFDLGSEASKSSVEVSAFLVDTSDGSQLAICMPRRLGPGAPIAPESAPLDPESRLAFILDTTPDGVVVIDRLGFVTSANAAAGRLLGYEPHALIAQPLSNLVTESTRAQGIARAIAAEGVVESEEIEVVRADGGRAWLSISARRHAFAQTDASYGAETIVFIRDITERYLSRNALERKNEELENFVRSVAHDLRSPLTSLLGFTHLLQSEEPQTLSAIQARFLARIEDAGRNMERLLQGMLELSRIGAAPHDVSRVNPRPVLMQIGAEQKLQLDEKRIVLSIPEDPPAVVCDPTRLYQLFSNLIGNAVSHMPAPSEPDASRRIDVEIEESESGWLISVADDGPGIDPADQDRIFEMFQTAGATSQGARSTGGLGLAIVKKIVEAHHGRVWVDSEVGQGACFRVQLPAANSDLDANAASDRAPGALGEGSDAL